MFSELCQEKQDQIDLLQTQLDKEREKLHQCEVLVANLNEQYKILSARFTQLQTEKEHISLEKDKFQGKLNECIYKIQKYREEVQEREEDIE